MRIGSPFLSLSFPFAPTSLDLAPPPSKAVFRKESLRRRGLTCRIATVHAPPPSFTPSAPVSWSGERCEEAGLSSSADLKLKRDFVGDLGKIPAFSVRGERLALSGVAAVAVVVSSLPVPRRKLSFERMLHDIARLWPVLRAGEGVAEVPVTLEGCSGRGEDDVGDEGLVNELQGKRIASDEDRGRVVLSSWWDGSMSGRPETVTRRRFRRLEAWRSSLPDEGFIAGPSIFVSTRSQGRSVGLQEHFRYCYCIWRWTLSMLVRAQLLCTLPCWGWSWHMGYERNHRHAAGVPVVVADWHCIVTRCTTTPICKSRGTFGPTPSPLNSNNHMQ